MLSAVELAMQKAENIPVFVVPKVFTYDPPVSRETIASWQTDIDAIVNQGERLSRLLVRYEPGDPWQPIHRFLLWQCVDPRYVTIEPWILKALNGPSPRSTGHYCAPGWCLCELKKNRWQGGATRFVDSSTWRLYRETGLYGQRWWTIQGTQGGHRFQWSPDEIASHISYIRTGKADTPSAGDLPYAPFDQRVLRQIMAERRSAAIEALLKDVGAQKFAVTQEEELEAKAKAKALWDWTEQRVESLWNDGADLLPRFFEEQYGRVPTGTRQTLDPETVERRFLES